MRRKYLGLGSATVINNCCSHLPSLILEGLPDIPSVGNSILHGAVLGTQAPVVSRCRVGTIVGLRLLALRQFRSGGVTNRLWQVSMVALVSLPV